MAKRQTAEAETLPLGDQPQQAPSTKNRQVATQKAAPPAAGPVIHNLLDVILAAGSDPRFDVEKFKALVMIQREEQDRQDSREEKHAATIAEAAFDAALAECQAKMGRVMANKRNSQTNSDYADYAAFDDMIRPIYAPAGFSLSFDEEDSPKAEHIRVVCWMTHVASGALRSHKRKYHIDMPADGKGAKGGDVMTKTHATGSAFTYGKRYVVGNIFNIAVSRDDDGNAAATKRQQGIVREVKPDEPLIVFDKQDFLRQRAEEVKCPMPTLLKHLGITKLEDLPVRFFDDAVFALDEWKRVHNERVRK